MATRALRWSALRCSAAFTMLLTAAPVVAQQRYGEERYEERASAVSQAHFVADFGARFVGIDDVDSQSFVGGATFYAPVDDSFGIALGGDLGFGAVEGDFGEAIGLHGAGFWRDPDVGYAGAALVFDHVSDFQRVNISAIGGLYLGGWDFLGAAGYDGGDGPGDGLFSLETGWYASEQLRLGGGLEFGTNETISGGVLIHWQPAEDSPVALRANLGGGEFDDEGFYSIGIGITISFSDRKSLRDLLRRDRLLVFE